MIVRINLIPGEKKRKKLSADSRVQNILALVLLAEIVLLVFLSMSMNAKVDDLRRVLTSKRAQKTRLEEELVGFPNLQTKMEELKRREDTLSRLMKLREGPQHVLTELSRILTFPRDAVRMREARDKGWNLSWEVDNVSLTMLRDLGNGEMEMEGTAKAMEDISEFWLRLKSSDLFRNVRLVEIRDEKPQSGVDVTSQKFIFESEVNFYYHTKSSVTTNQKEAESDTSGGGTNG